MLNRPLIAIVLAALLFGRAAEIGGQPRAVEERLNGFDDYIAQVMRDWDVPGLGVAVVVRDSVVFARGYGYRDYGGGLPFTTRTLFPIASNTKLFTAVAAGLLVQDGKLEWDTPLRLFVPRLEFHNDELDRAVTMRDMLAHRTGINRHDNVWFRSDLSRQDLFERIRYLEPSVPLRSRFLYNNIMYVGAGYCIELLSGTSWEDFVRDRILTPLGMTNTIFSVAEMRRQPDYATPYAMRRDTTELYELEFYEEDAGVAPAAAMISNLEDMSRWLVALINGGRVAGRQMLPPAVVEETLVPTLRLPEGSRVRAWKELLNPVYGMGRWTAQYRGRRIAYHGGSLPGFHSQVSVMPADSIGVVVFVMGDHAGPLHNAISFNVYERLLRMSPMPWSELLNVVRLRNREVGAETRRLDADRLGGSLPPTHPLAEFTGDFTNPAYGGLSIALADTALTFEFRGERLPLRHSDRNRFDTPDDEHSRMWSVNFPVSLDGEIHRLEIALDHKVVVFERQYRAAPGLDAGAEHRPDTDQVQP